MKATLKRPTFTLTDSELERLFLPIALKAGLPLPADAQRDQAHLKAGRTPLRFTHWQVRYEPAEVEATPRGVAERLAWATRLWAA